MQRVAAQDDASLREARSLLGTLRHSASPACSDAELSYFRELVFRSNFLRDAGRIHGGSIECSAAAGRPLAPIVQFNAGTAEPDGTVVYGNLAAVQIGTREGRESNKAIFLLFSALNCRWSNGRLPDSSGNQPGWRRKRRSMEPGAQAASGAEGADSCAREGENLAARHCSAIPQSCVTASGSVDEARQGESGAVASTAVSAVSSVRLLESGFCFIAAACNPSISN